MAKVLAPGRINRECCCYLLISKSARRESEKLFAPALKAKGCFFALRPQNFSARHVFAALSRLQFHYSQRTNRLRALCRAPNFLFLTPRLFLCSTFRAQIKIYTRQSSATDKNKLSHFSAAPAAWFSRQRLTAICPFFTLDQKKLINRRPLGTRFIFMLRALKMI